MKNRVFSQGPGSPRLPSASFARVDGDGTVVDGGPDGIHQARDLPACRATPDHNGEPVCACGWDPAQHGARSRRDALAKIYRHAEARP